MTSEYVRFDADDSRNQPILLPTFRPVPDASSNDHSLGTLNDPSSRLKPGSRLESLQEATLGIVENLLLRGVSLLIVLIDIALVIVSLAKYGVSDDSEPDWYADVAIAFAVFFLLELLLRIFARGRAFFRYWYEILDLVVIGASFILTMVYVSLESNKYLKLVLVGRLVRIFLIARIVNERYQLSRLSRRMVSENKRRYMKDGFDLDLTYVTERVIAMGFPSTGKAGLYRNSASEVRRFLDLKHCKNYKVYNLCRERGYDHLLFHGRVSRVLIDDHNVAFLTDIVAFCEDVHQWMEKDPHNVIAVHCKGGKGRTGTMICCWLLRCHMFENADKCLEYFGERRTDRTKGKKYQGVQTPSQSRYVHYYDQILHRLNGVVPESVKYKIRTLRISGIKSIGVGDGSDLCLEILNEMVPICECYLFSPGWVEKAEVDRAKDILTVNFQLNAIPRFGGNMKFRFSCSTKMKLKGLYDNSLFFFWFHTGFIAENRLFLSRQQLDNPHKPKTHSVFKEHFSVELLFSPA